MVQKFKTKKLTYDIITFTIISDKVTKIEGLEITYNSKEISNLFSSKITIKNIGNSIIEKNDFAPSFPLSIKTNGKFLTNEKTQIELCPSNKANNANPIFDETANRIYIDFDFLSPNDTLKCSILHTDDIILEGALKDGKLITPLERIKIQNRKNILKNIIVIAIYFITLLLALFFNNKNGASR